MSQQTRNEDLSTWSTKQLHARAQALSLAETLGDISRADERDAILAELAARRAR